MACSGSCRCHCRVADCNRERSLLRSMVVGPGSRIGAADSPVDWNCVDPALSGKSWNRRGVGSCRRQWVRRLAIALTAVSTVLNFAALFLLTKAIFQGHAGTGRTLLLDAINIWATNVVIFAFWFWTLDRGSPSSRGLVLPDKRDFLFTQQQQAPDTNPRSRTGLRVSWTTCFSPTRMQRRFRPRTRFRSQSGPSFL